MALFKSQVLTQASGSVGGLTYSHSNGGMYMRARAIPVNSNTAFQQDVRDALTTLINTWTNILTAGQRNGWNLYGANTPTVNALGSTINLSGQNWFVACNTPRLQAANKLASAFTFVAAAPTIFDRGGFSITPTLPTYDEVTGFSMVYDDGDTWNAAGGAMFIYQGRPLNPSRNYFAGPYRLILAVDGGAPGVSPATVTAANLEARGFQIGDGQHVYTRVTIQQPDGRLSTALNLGPSIVTP